MASSSRSVPIFICSTFFDMHVERDAIRRRVVPDLDERLREKGAEVELVDLRWGPQTLSENDLARREERILSVSLDEIVRCRRFMVVLIGERYGWVPDAQKLARIAEEHRLPIDAAGLSVTELEIELGVFRQPDAEEDPRVFVYLREPLDWPRLPAAEAARLSDAQSAAGDPDPDSRASAKERAARLRALVERLEAARLPWCRVRRYAARWDADAGRLTGLEDFVHSVTDDLWSAIVDKRADSSTGDGRGGEPADLGNLEGTSIRDQVERPEIVDRLVAFARQAVSAEVSPSTRCILLAGEIGAGKTVVMCQVAASLRGAGVLVLSHAAAGARRGMPLARLLANWLHQLGVAREIDSSPREDAAPTLDAEIQRFRRHLQRIAASSPVAILLDGIDEIEPEIARLSWLPTELPDRFRLIVAGTGDMLVSVLGGRSDMRIETLPPLSLDQARTLARATTRRYGRTLPPSLESALLARERVDGTPAYVNPLWLKLAVERLNLVSGADFARADRDFAALSPSARVDAMLLDLVRAMPPELDGLYSHSFATAEYVFGAPLVAAFLTLLATTRCGWRNEDLRRLLPRLMGGAPMDAAGDGSAPGTVAELRRAFRGHIASASAPARWSLAHRSARSAVERRYLDPCSGTSVLDAVQVHTAIAEHLWGAPDSDASRMDLTWHLMYADDRARVATMLSRTYSPVLYGHLDAVPVVEALGLAISSDPDRWIPWVTSLLPSPEVARQLGIVVELFCVDVWRDLLSRAATAVAIRFLEGIAATIAGLKIEPGPFRGKESSLARVLHKLSFSYAAIGEIAMARAADQKALEATAGSPVLRGQAEKSLADSYLREGNLREGLLHAVAALEHESRQMLTMPPLVSYAPLASTHITVGDAFFAARDGRHAFQHFAVAYRYAQAVADLARRDVRASAGATFAGEAPRLIESPLSTAAERVGSICLRADDCAGALLFFAISRDAQDRANRTASEDRDMQHSFAVGEMKLGEVLEQIGERSRAVACFERAFAVLAALRARAPDDRSQTELARTNQERQMAARVRQGDHVGALRHAEMAAHLCDQLTGSGSAEPRRSEDRAKLALVVALLNFALGQAAEGVRELRRALALFGTIPAAPYPARARSPVEQLERWTGQLPELANSEPVLPPETAHAALVRIFPDKAHASTPLVSQLVELIAQDRIADAMETYRGNLSPSADTHDLVDGIHRVLRDVLSPAEFDHGAFVLEAKAAAANVLARLGARADAARIYRATVGSPQPGPPRAGAMPPEAAVSALLAQGHLARREGRPVEAERHYSDALAFCEGQIASGGGQGPWAEVQAIARDGLGDSLRDQGRLAEALPLHEASAAFFESIAVDGKPRAMHSLAVSLGKVGTVLTHLRVFPKALAQQERAAAILARLAEVPEMADHATRGSAVAESTISDIHAAMGDPRSARDHQLRALQLFKRLVADNEDLEGVRDVAISHGKLAALCDAVGDWRGVSEHKGRWLEVLRSMQGRGIKLDPHLERLGSQMRTFEERAHPVAAPVEIPPPHPASDPDHAAARNIAYQEARRAWEALPWWKRLFGRGPLPPTGI